MGKYVLTEKEAKDAYIAQILDREDYMAYNGWIVDNSEEPTQLSSIMWGPVSDSFPRTLSALNKLQRAGLIYEEKPNDTIRPTDEQKWEQADIILGKIEAKIDAFEKNPLDIIKMGETKVHQSHIDTFVENMKKVLQDLNRNYGLTSYIIFDKQKELKEKFDKVSKRLDVIKSNFLGYQNARTEANMKRHEYQTLKAEYDQMSPLKKMLAGKKKKDMEQARKESVVGMFDEYMAKNVNEQGGKEL